MTRYAIDLPVALRLVEADAAVPHRLVAPNLLRSQALAELYRSVRQGRRSEREGLQLLNRVAELRIRLLGDRVSRATSWRIAADLGWDDTGKAEYLAVAKLQADAIVTLDPDIERGAAGIVPVAPLSALLL